MAFSAIKYDLHFNEAGAPTHFAPAQRKEGVQPITNESAANGEPLEVKLLKPTELKKLVRDDVKVPKHPEMSSRFDCYLRDRNPKATTIFKATLRVNHVPSPEAALELLAKFFDTKHCVQERNPRQQ
jgi:hypothetical protein